MDELPLLARLLLRIYPEAFRRRFGDSIEEALRDRLAAVEARGGPSRWWTQWRVLADLAGSGLKERFAPAYAPSDVTSGPRASILDAFGKDLRFAFRSLRRNLGFTVTTLATLTVGLGATTAVFSVVWAVLLRPLPFAEPDDLVMVWTHDADSPEARGWQSLPDIDDLRNLDAIVGLEGWQPGSFTYAGNGQPEQIGSVRLTGGILELLGYAPAMGRDLRRSENDPGAPRVVLLSHDFWRTRLGGRENVVGTTIELSERSYEIVGVAPAGFAFPDDPAVWTPYRHTLDGCGRGCSVYQAVGRLAPDQTDESVSGQLEALSSGLSEQYPNTNIDKLFRTEPLVDFLVGDVRAGLWVLMGAVGLVLLIVCANVANLLLARGAGRRSEVAVRSALGASRPRLVSQILTESLVLAALGGLLAVGVSTLFVQGFRWLAPVSLPRMEAVGLTAPVLAFALLATLGVAALFGLSPALHLAWGSSASTLNKGIRRGTGREARVRSSLMAVEIALSLALLAGAGLLTRSLGQLYRVDLGFQARDVVRFSLSLPAVRYDTLPELVAFYGALEERLSSLPGVESVGSAFGAPLGGGNIGGSVRIENREPPPPGQESFSRIRPATPGYLAAVQLPLIRGRGIEAGDGTDSEPVAVINQTFAAQNFPGEDPLGQRVRVGANFGWADNGFRTVVGVVGDVRSSLRGTPDPAMYVPHAQFGPGFLRVHVRAGPGVLADLVPMIRNEVRAMDPTLPLTDVETVREAIRGNAASTRFYLLLVSLFAGLAAVVASVGLYGVVAYLASGRTREFGVRVALGARDPDIASLVVRQGLAPTVAGVAGGLLVTVIGARWIESLLFGVQPRDPLILTSVTVVVVALATAASLIPARRAARVDPTEALRAE